MSTYSPSLGLEEITPGDQAGLWGDTTNNNLVLIDQAITGVQPISFAGVGGTTVTLVATDGSVTSTARSAVLNITGTATAANTVIVPNKQKTYLVRNNTTKDVVFTTASPTATYTVGAGNSILIFCDGNNGVFTGIEAPGSGTLGVAGGGTGTTDFGPGGFVVSPGGTDDFTNLEYVPVGGTQPNLIVGQVQVPNGGTGQLSISTGSLLAGNGIGAMTVLPTGTSGQVLTSNGSGANPSWQAAGSSLLSSNNSWSGTNAFVTAPTVGGYNVLTTNTGATLAGTNTWTGSNIFNNGINFTSNTSWAYNSGTSTVQLAINGQSAATFNYSSGITSSGGFTTGINPSYYNTQVYLTNNSIGINGTGVPSNTGIYYDVTVPAWAITLGSGRLGYAFTNSVFVCSSDNAASCGDSSRRWTAVYAVNGAIQTSDANEKTEISDLDEVEKRVATRIKGLIKKFKWKDAVAKKGSDGARIHVGVIAQEVGDAFRAEGLDPHKYGMFCYDEWEDKPASVDDKGVVMQEAVPAGARYGVRYEELLSFVIAAL